MREILVINIGNCGNNIGSRFWEYICDEHGINTNGYFVGSSPLQTQRLNVYFDEGSRNRYVPRSIFMDLDPNGLDHVRYSIYGKVFDPTYFLSESKGASNNWATGRYTLGPILVDAAEDVIRSIVEKADCLQGFQVTQSLGGGTGSGLGTLLMMKLKEYYPEKILATFSVLPSHKVSNSVVEPYNSILSLNHLIESCDECFCVCNEALYNICTNSLKLEHPTYNDMNYLITCTMSGVTSCFRFPGQLNSDLRKLQVNMVPFPRLHFFIPGYVPLTTRGSSAYKAQNVQSLVQQMFNSSSMMSNCNPKNGKYLTAAAIFRGRMSVKEVEDQMRKMQNKNSSNFVEWIPNNIKTAVCDVSPRGTPMAATFIGNSTAMQEPLRDLRSKTAVMLKKKAFLHWFTSEGLDLKELDEASQNVLDLIAEYQQYQEGEAEHILSELDVSLGDLVSDEVPIDEDEGQ